MTTPQLFVELLIIGVGVAIWLVLLISSIFGYHFYFTIQKVNIPFLTAIVGVAYVLGIVIDRIAYSLFYFIEKRNKIKVFGKSPDPNLGDRERYILVNSEALRQQIIYNRSRIRICRSWILNYGLIGIFFTTWSIRTKPFAFYKSVVILLLITMFCLLSMIVFHRLSRDHYNNIKASYEFLSNSTQSADENS